MARSRHVKWMGFWMITLCHSEGLYHVFNMLTVPINTCIYIYIVYCSHITHIIYVCTHIIYICLYVFTSILLLYSSHFPSSEWKKSCTTLDAWNPIVTGINHPSTGAGFLPSTVCFSFSHGHLQLLPAPQIERWVKRTQKIGPRKVTGVLQRLTKET